MKRFLPRLAVLLLALSPIFISSSTLPLLAQQKEEKAEPFDVKAHYTKYEFRIPMRDGVHLFTSVYVPKDTSRPYPFLMQRTPYSVGPYGEDHYRERLGPSISSERAGYVFVFQDVRGRYQSEGRFIEMRPSVDPPKAGATDESTDTYDTVEWLLKHVPNNNGKVGIWGISYPGFFTSASIINSHPAIKAASPEAPMTNLFEGDDGYHGGAFMLAANFDFYSIFRPRATDLELPPVVSAGRNFQYGVGDGYEYFLEHGPDLTSIAAGIKNPLFDDQMNHNTEDAYWKPRDLSQHMKGIKCAVLTVGGWFDAEDLWGPFRTYHAIEKNNPGIFNALVVGPWVHGGWARYQGESLGRVQFNSATGEFWREHIIFPFFEQYLKGNGDAKLPEAYVFETGSNVWKQYDAWPPQQVRRKTLYVHAGGKLSFEPPSPGDKEAEFDEYVSDPKKPVPFIGYAATGVPQEYMLSDQRFAAKRPDVLTYQTEPLAEDVTISGPIAPQLRVSTSGTDSDYVVKLIDVYPDDYDAGAPRPPNATPPKDVPMPVEKMGGYQMLVRGEPMRAKFRNSKSWDKPEAMVPNQVTAVNYQMQDVNHTFRRGHRIMIQIQSSWFPLIDMNPQTFVDTAKATKADFVKATERVYHSPSEASGVQVGVMPKE
ncbi:MAG: CocE/NonD family hydrolase [Acidobacteriaceae bacterium]